MIETKSKEKEIKKIEYYRENKDILSKTKEEYQKLDELNKKIRNQIISTREGKPIVDINTVAKYKLRDLYAIRRNLQLYSEINEEINKEFNEESRPKVNTL